MNSKQRKQLRAKRSFAMQKAVDAALAGKSEDLDRFMRDVATCDRLLSALPPNRWRESLIAACVGLICVSLIGLAWTLRIPGTKFTLAVEGDGVTVALASPWSWSGGLAIDPVPARLADFSLIEVPSAQSVGKRLEGRPWAEISGGQVMLNRLAAEDGSQITFEYGADGALRIFARNATFSGEMTVQGAAKIVGGSEVTRQDVNHLLSPAFPETVRFLADGTGAIPARLALHPSEALALNDMPVRGISFTREVPDRPGSIVFVSTIGGGSITLSDVARTVKLRKGEALFLKGLSGRITDIQIDGMIKVLFQGSAEEIRLGAAGFDRNLSPTVIDYLYHNQRVPLVWSGLVFLWGIIWSTRKFLFN